jgi:hypothetical protein
MCHPVAISSNASLMEVRWWKLSFRETATCPLVQWTFGTITRGAGPAARLTIRERLRVLAQWPKDDR